MPEREDRPSAGSTTAIEFRDVSYSAPGGHRVFDHFNLTVQPGEVVALVGRSGAGKTTLLRFVNRLAVPDGGEVLVERREIRQWDAIALRRSIGYVIQDVGLFPHMTVAGNIAVVPRLQGWDETRIAGRVAELIELVGLSPAVHAPRYPDELSGGQRQRVGVARALAADPHVLLMDEPFGALDPVTRAELQREFRGIQTRLNKTVIIVTHDMAEALSLGDRIAVLDGGLLVTCAPPEDIMRSSDGRVRQLLDAVLIPSRSFPPAARLSAVSDT